VWRSHSIAFLFWMVAAVKKAKTHRHNRCAFAC